MDVVHGAVDEMKPSVIDGNDTELFCSRMYSAYVQYMSIKRRHFLICECLDAGSEAPLEPSTSQLTSYAVRLSPTNTHSSSQLSPRNSGASQQWGGGFESAQNQPWQAGEGNLSSSPAPGSSRPTCCALDSEALPVFGCTFPYPSRDCNRPAFVATGGLQDGLQDFLEDCPSLPCWQS